MFYRPFFDIINSCLILDNLNKIRYRLRAAAQRAGRDPDRVGFVVVTKYATPEQVREVIASGLAAELGESRVQAAEAKKRELGDLAQRVRWRLIGHLQTNKARKAAELFDAVDSVDSLRVAQALEQALAELAKKLPVLVQVKLTGRETQSGVPPEDLSALLEGLQRIRIWKRGALWPSPRRPPAPRRPGRISGACASSSTDFSRAGPRRSSPWA